jgi:hypothetical protein
MMSRLLASGAVLVAMIAIIPARSRADDPPAASHPSAFEMLCLTGKNAGSFHCPVCDFGVHPFALVFVRDPNKVDADVSKFLKELDGLVAQHPDSAFGAAIVFVGDGTYRQALLNADDQTGEKLDQAQKQMQAVQDKVRDLARAQGLTHVQIGLLGSDAKSSHALAAYHVPANAQCAVFAFTKLSQIGHPAIFAKAPHKAELDKALKPIRATVLKAEKANRAED